MRLFMLGHHDAVSIGEHTAKAVRKFKKVTMFEAKGKAAEGLMHAHGILHEDDVLRQALLDADEVMGTAKED